MKSIIKILLALVLVLGITSANAQVMDSTKKSNPVHNKDMSMEYVTLVNGAVMHYMNNKSTALASTFITTDGTKVSTDGTVTKKDGKTMKLAEGDKVYKDGHMTWGKTGTGDMPGSGMDKKP